MEGGQARKGRSRDAALTWEVPPALEPDFVRKAAEEGTETVAPTNATTAQRPTCKSDVRQLHPLVEIQRQAFEGPAQQHLAAIVGQLLAAELVSVWFNK